MPAPATAQSQRFNLLLYITKAEQRDGKWWVTGIATGSQEDWYGDVMAPACVASMVRQFNAGTLPLRSNHAGDWETDMGTIREGAVQPGGDASIGVLLDDLDPRSQKLIRSLTKDPPAKLGFSIGGMADYDSITWETRDGKNVRVIHDITLDHVAVTSQPAYPNAWASGVTQKSQHAFPWWTGGELSIRKALDALQAEPPAPPVDAAVTPAVNEGGTAVEDVTKAAGEAGDGTAADETGDTSSSDACPGMQGEWKAIDAIGPQDQVLCMKSADAPDSSTEDTDMEDKSTPLTEERVIQLAATAGASAAAEVIKSLGLVPPPAAAAAAPATDTPDATDTAPDRSTAVAKGLRTDAAASRPAGSDAQTPDPIATLKATDEYKNANQIKRAALLKGALQSGLTQIAQG